MATIVLSAAGAALGGSIGGTVAGLSTAVIGRAVGATIGKVIDQSILGSGSDAIETGRVDRFRLSNAGEGEPVSQVFGRTRLGGQVIWASDFAEEVTVSSGGGGGKGAPSAPETRSYSYSVNLAVGICEGEITRIGRIWANGEEVAPETLNMRIYKGREDQLPDPTMEAIEGAGNVPAYRGTAYVVFENLALEPFGNRVPQFSFEVSRPEQTDEPGAEFAPTYGIKAVAVVPGTGEYSLATTPVYYTNGPGSSWSANINSPAQRPDFSVSLETLSNELPNCEAASLIVSWFGDDLRCGECRIRPRVEKKEFDGGNMPWTVSGLTRADAEAMPLINGRPVYGGTPTDQSIIEAIQAMKAAGKAVMFYPFILMDQLAGTTRPNPYEPGETQPALPWRGRITTSMAPGIPGTTDKTAAAQAEVDAFFGTVNASHFGVADGTVTYTGPNEWTLSRFVLHYAALVQAAGGVEAFCIGSELRGLTQIRAENNRFPAVERLRQLAQQVRLLVGPRTKISYAADWSEYFGYQPQDGSSDRFFHLDPLWADPNIDFIGIDNYMPLSDWRDGSDHLDAAAETIYDLDYLKGNIEGGEGFDWFYTDQTARSAQQRTPIEDGAYGEPWVFRYKDLRGWWENQHFDRIGGARVAIPTAWVPQSKPFWFTELGCAAIDKGTNQPNKFLDPKSSESQLPHFSNGSRDDLIQTQYLRAMTSHWAQAQSNPVSPIYGGPMVDMTRAFVWAWDARPYPYFPNNQSLWSDSGNYSSGHWLNGRMSSRSLASVVSELCRSSGVTEFDTSRLFGLVRGYNISQVEDARSALQPLMLQYGFDAVERDGVLSFRMRGIQTQTDLDPDALATSADLDSTFEQIRDADATLAGRVRLRFLQADASFDAVAEEAVLDSPDVQSVSTSELPLVLTRAEGRQTAERWLTESRVARDAVRFALPPSQLRLGAGDVVSLPSGQGGERATYRIDRVEQGALQLIEAVRVDGDVYTGTDIADEPVRTRVFVPPAPVQPLFMDLPLMTGDEVVHAPHLAVTAVPWPGSVSVYSSPGDSNFRLLDLVEARSFVGVTETDMLHAPSGRIDNGAALRVRLLSGTASSIDRATLLSGANLAAIGDGTSWAWELFQFQDADLVEPDTYAFSQRLRGQFGTDGVMPDVWPAGSFVILMNGLPQQVPLSRNLRGVDQTYRIGPAKRPVSDPSYVEEVMAFRGVGLRPYSPVHLRADMTPDGGLLVKWVRRTRSDGDTWDAPDVPLGEEREAYLLRIYKGDTLLREAEADTNEWIYTLSQQAADGASGTIRIEVAQMSATFGPGPFVSRDLLL